MATDDVFGNDLGFFAGRGMGHREGSRKATNMAIKLIQAEDEANERQRAQDMMVRKNIMMEKIQNTRAKNLLAMAEYEYDIHVQNDVSKRIVSAGEKLSEYAKNGGAKSEELQLLSDSLMGAREIHWSRDRDEWINARYNELIQHVKFPTNDIEALATGGYAMPKVETIPPFLERDKEELAENKRDWSDVVRLIVDDNYGPHLIAKLDRGGMKIG